MTGIRMTLFQWLNAVIDGMMGTSGRGGRRNSVWSRCSSAAKEVQGLEAKCLLSATPLAEPSIEQPALTNVDMNSLVLMSEAGFIQFNAIGLQDLSSLSPSQRSQFIYGPQLPVTTFPTPSEDLYDEGAGAVWGSLSDEGAPSSNIPGGTFDGTGAVDMGVDGIMGTDTGGAVYSPPGPGDYGPGDYGPGDYGPGDTADTGYDTFGVNDAPVPETGDFPSADNGVDGPGDTGPGDTGPGDVDGVDAGQELDVEVSITSLTTQFYEGPYARRKLDRALLSLSRDSIDDDNVLEAATATLKFTGKAKFGADYYITEFDGLGTFTFGIGEHANEVTVILDSPDGLDLFYLVSSMDGDYELDEDVKLAIVNVSTNAEIGDNSNAETILIDSTGDLDIDGLNEDTEDKPGANIKLNDDDDNNNNQPDYLDGIHDIYDNDLAPMSLTSHLLSPNDYAPYARIADDLVASTVSYFVLQFDQTKVRIYKSNCEVVLPGITEFSDVDGSTFSFFVEGIGKGIGSISLEWIVEINDPGGSLDGIVVFHETFDTVKYTVWGLDLDIDSDNNNGFSEPDHGKWEEYLEDNEFAIGKMLTTQDSQFTPMTLQLPPGLDIQNRSITIDIDPDNLATRSGDVRLWNTYKADPTRSELFLYQGGNQVAFAEQTLEELRYNPVDGKITIWLEATSVTNFHDTKREVQSGGKPEDRFKVTLHGVAEFELRDIVKFMVIHPDSFFKALNDSQTIRDAFASELVYGPRGSDGESNSEAAPMDDKRWGLRKIEREELEEMLAGVDAKLVKMIIDNLYRVPTSTEPGHVYVSNYAREFAAALYLDHVSGKFVLSFRGTNFRETVDWLNNLSQGATGYAPQYDAAQLVSYGLSLATALNTWTDPGVAGLELTGHSLGGGLASAGAIAAGVHAQTFNAAGLQVPEVFLQADGTDLVSGASGRYALRNTLIQTYAVWLGTPRSDGSQDAPDILTYLQKLFDVQWNGKTFLPDAVGVETKLDGLYNLTADEYRLLNRIRDLIVGFEGEPLSSFLPLFVSAGWQFEPFREWLRNNYIDVYATIDWPIATSLITKLTNSHGMENILHGLMIKPGWNVYDVVNPQQGGVQ